MGNVYVNPPSLQDRIVLLKYPKVINMISTSIKIMVNTFSRNQRHCGRSVWDMVVRQTTDTTS
jgi:hypothetical protein